MNLRSQKGATGADIMIAISVIVLSVAVVSMIYVNTTLQSRNVTRTAGATRIATNILENIEKLSYTDFIAEYNATKWTLIDDDTEDANDRVYIGYKKITNNTAFSTKIPKGYTVYLFGEPNYGSYTGASNISNQFDLVRNVRLVVTFKVGDMVRAVDFTTSKTREITNEVNPPDTAVLGIQNIANATIKYYPIKYSEDANAYMKTTEDDEEWYNYSNKKWAMILVSSQAESDLFDLNGKVKATSGFEKYVWVPKFFTSESDGTGSITKFAYLSSSTQIIEEDVLSAVNTDVELHYNTVKPKPDTSYETNDFVVNNNQKVSGIWVKVSQIDTQKDTKLLKASKYGPCELH